MHCLACPDAHWMGPRFGAGESPSGKLEEEEERGYIRADNFF